MTLEQLIGYLGYVALAIGGYFIIRGTAAKNTIDVLEANNKALNERVEILEREKVSNLAELHKVQGQVEVLKDLVTGTSAIKALGEQIARAFADGHADHQEMTEILRTISTQLTKTSTPAPEVTVKVSKPKAA